MGLSSVGKGVKVGKEVGDVVAVRADVKIGVIIEDGGVPVCGARNTAANPAQ